MNTQSNYEKAKIPDFDSEQALTHLNLILSRGQGCAEVRLIPKAKSFKTPVLIGYFDDVKKLVNDVKSYSGKYQIYVGINPRKSVMLHAQTANTLLPSPEGGREDDVAGIYFLPIDIDTKKESNKVAASDIEVKNALEVAKAIGDELTLRGVNYLFAFSGNGWHILVPTVKYEVVKFKADNQFSHLLEYFNGKYSNQHAHVDVSTFDAPRVWKLYGSVAIKGGNTNERPWRLAKIVSGYNSIKNVDILAIYSEELAAIKRNKSQRTPTVPPAMKSSLLELFKGATNVHR